MKQIDITNKNKDLDLRRYGKMLYTNAKNNEGGGGGSELSLIAQSISMHFPSSVPQPIGVYRRGSPYRYHYIMDCKKFFSGDTSKDAIIENWEDSSYTPPKNAMVLYPAGTELQEGMIVDAYPYYELSGFYIEDEWPSHIMQEITLNGKTYAVPIENS